MTDLSQSLNTGVEIEQKLIQTDVINDDMPSEGIDLLYALEEAVLLGTFLTSPFML
jgi:hypothetical protein